MPGSQDFADDPRNAAARIYLNGALVAREEALVSVLDAGFVLGDGVWEGLRVHNGRILFLKPHLDRLYAGARAIALEIGLSPAELTAAIQQTLDANGMRHGVHIRLMVTRGKKKAPNQDPRNALGKPTIVIIAEYKEPSLAIATKGLSLFTATIRCTPADMFDMRINSHSRLSLIMALNQAIAAGADEALMLDPNGFVSSCNATNFFFVRGGEVCTSTGDFCFNGITRQNVITICCSENIPVRLGNFVLGDIYNADEAFVTGTFGGLTPVRSVDSRQLPGALPGPMTRRLRERYAVLKDVEAMGVF
ncbi:MAG TPA: aminotransferase class IV [Rhizomicrobium sp.]|nr:aminotransferase class IV [Rhizomicrobium sp.]